MEILYCTVLYCSVGFLSILIKDAEGFHMNLAREARREDELFYLKCYRNANEWPAWLALPAWPAWPGAPESCIKWILFL